MLHEIKKNLELHKEEIIKTLMEIETEKVALEEYDLCIKALNNNNKYGKTIVDVISSYLPMNLPLYSLIIYVVIPKICASRSNYRPSSKNIEQTKKIHNLLNLEKYNINLYEGTRFDYLKNKVINSNVVIFIGKPENAEKISKNLDNKTMFIYFGVGQNPVIIANNANLKVSSKKIAEAIMFNYGQDCAKPNVILCQKSLYKDFVKNLIVEIEKNLDQKTSIKNLEVLKDVANLLTKNIDYIEYGGNINFKDQTLEPVIITKKLTDDCSNYKEYYAPIFRIMLYESNLDLKKYFSNKMYKDESMNISLFGKSTFIEELPSSLVLHNEMVSDIDNGYCEYGGYGEKTSYLLYEGVKIIKPILINREIDFFYNNKKFIYFSNKTSNSISDKERLKNVLFNEYKTYIQELFKNNLQFSFVFGSYAKGIEKISSDIDMFICLQELNEELNKKFREWYFKYHYMYGKIPDFYYPGEIITEEKLNDIIRINKNIEINIKNDSDTFDALFYTQILTDKKREIIGSKELLMNYCTEFNKFIPSFCNQIYELLDKNNMIVNERDQMKCLFALSNNDLLFFCKRLEYEEPEDYYTDIVKKLDDGFLVKCLKRKF